MMSQWLARMRSSIQYVMRTVMAVSRKPRTCCLLKIACTARLLLSGAALACRLSRRTGTCWHQAVAPAGLHSQTLSELCSLW